MKSFQRNFVFSNLLLWFCLILCFNQKCVTAFCSLSLNKTVQNPLWKIQICPEFINLIMEYNWYHKFGVNGMLYNVAMKVLLLLLRIFIRISLVCFTATKCPSETSIYLSVYTNEPGIKPETSGFMWQVVPQSKIQLVSCELSPNYPLGISTLEDIYAIGAFIDCDLLWSVLFSSALSILVDLYAPFLGFSVFQWTFLSEVSGFGNFVIKWSSNPRMKHVFGFRPIH